MNKHQQEIAKAHSLINEKSRTVSQDDWRLHYHVMPEANWMNDPNGFCMWNGEYHLFYQHHPYSPEWGPMYWGHVKSKDLVHWERLPIALAPSESYDKDGCFSGSAIEKDGKLYLFYTGNQWTGPDQETDLKQVQCLAVSEDGIHFEKINENPVIDEAPDGDIHPFHFRDPKVWKKGDMYYCVLGSQTKNRMGQALLYQSSDLIHWEFVNILAKGQGNQGYMWECPDLFQLDDTDVLVMSPQGVHPEGDYYHNLHQSVAVMGHFHQDKGNFTSEKWQILDHGFDFYAPQTMLDEQGRRIVIAWMAMWESEMPEQKQDWAGAMTIPRILSIEKEKLRIDPIPELASLRYDPIRYQKLIVDQNKKLDGVHGDCLEMKVSIDAQEATKFGLNLRMNETGTERTNLTYYVDEEKIVLDRSKSGKGPGGVRKAPLALQNGKLQLHLFIDKSSVEIFMQNGEKVMSARIYPERDSTGIEFFSDAAIEMIQLEKWSLKQSV